MLFNVSDLLIAPRSYLKFLSSNGLKYSFLAIAENIWSSEKETEAVTLCWCVSMLRCNAKLVENNEIAPGTNNLQICNKQDLMFLQSHHKDLRLLGCYENFPVNA